MTSILTHRRKLHDDMEVLARRRRKMFPQFIERAASEFSFLFFIATCRSYTVLSFLMLMLIGKGIWREPSR